MVETYTNILVAVDGSDLNRCAVRDAVCVAKSMNAKLTAIYVVTGADLKPNAFGGDVSASERAGIAHKSADEAFKQVVSDCNQAGIDLKTIIANGNPASELIKLSEEYDLIVCGSLGASGLSKVLMGSVSTELVKHSKCPILISRRS